MGGQSYIRLVCKGEEKKRRYLIDRIPMPVVIPVRIAEENGSTIVKFWRDVMITTYILLTGMIESGML